jgi:hypothetical protein
MRRDISFHPVAFDTLTTVRARAGAAITTIAATPSTAGAICCRPM